MVKTKMAETASGDVPRPRDPPLPEEVLGRMAENEPYVVADLVAEFEGEYGPARGTVRNRLEYLADEGEVKRKKHENGTVTYRRPE
jgi:Fe2+ or Zn2+ uptake regulation protein